MRVTVDIDEGRVRALVIERIGELFSADARYRQAGVRDMVRQIVDKAAEAAIYEARTAIQADLTPMATEALRKATQEELERSARRGLGALRKLFAGFDPARLTPEQADWVKQQMARAAMSKSDKPDNPAER